MCDSFAWNIKQTISKNNPKTFETLQQHLSSNSTIFGNV